MLWQIFICQINRDYIGILNLFGNKAFINLVKELDWKTKLYIDYTMFYYIKTEHSY